MGTVYGNADVDSACESSYFVDHPSRGSHAQPESDRSRPAATTYDRGHRSQRCGQELAGASTRSTPRATGDMSRRSRLTRASSSRASTSPTPSVIAGIPPAIAVGPPRVRRSLHSTVGTITEIHHALGLLFARAGPGDVPPVRPARRARLSRDGLASDRRVAGGHALRDRLSARNSRREPISTRCSPRCVAAGSRDCGSTASRSRWMGRIPRLPVGWHGRGHRRSLGSRQRPCRPPRRLDRDGLRGRSGPVPDDRAGRVAHIRSRLAVQPLRNRPHRAAAGPLPLQQPARGLPGLRRDRPHDGARLEPDRSRPVPNDPLRRDRALVDPGLSALPG